MNRRRGAIRFVICLILSSVCSQALVHAQGIRESEISDRVSALRMKQTVKTLVKFGNRLGGTTSGDRSVQYLQKEFAKTGFDVSVTEDPERLVCETKGWELQVVKPRRLRTLIRHEWLSGFSPSVPRQSAALCYYDGEEHPGVRGKVVLTAQTVTKALYETLVEEGAVCIVSFAPADSSMYRNAAMISDLPASANNAIPAFNVSFSAGSRLREELKRGTEISIRFSSKTSVALARPKTLVATIKGRSDDYFVVCAHGDSDSGGPGADDNASGVAGTLELARVFSDAVKGKKLPIPEKSISFVIWGSEYTSATAYVRSRKNDLGKILGVINYDQIGSGHTRDCVYFESNDVPHNEGLLTILQQVGEEYAGRRGFWSEATTNPSQGGTDSYVFLPDYLAQLGLPRVEIPSITVYTAAWNSLRTIPQTDGWSSKAWKGHRDSVTIDYSPYYHSSRDIPELTTERESHSMTSAVRAVGIGLLRLAWHPTL